jgi:hypothetical protein
MKNDDKDSNHSATDVINELKSKTQVFFDVLKSSQAEGGQPLHDSLTSFMVNSKESINEVAAGFHEKRKVKPHSRSVVKKVKVTHFAPDGDYLSQSDDSVDLDVPKDGKHQTQPNWKSTVTSLLKRDPTILVEAENEAKLIKMPTAKK